jgi:hypothetical protein
MIHKIGWRLRTITRLAPWHPKRGEVLFNGLCVAIRPRRWAKLNN